MKIHLNGIDIFYKKTGQGPALILLHGVEVDHTIFDKLTEKLKDHFTVYALDSRNHGGTDKTTDYSYKIMADDVAAFIKELNLGKVNLLGFSDGSVIALHVVLAHMELIEKVALLGLNLKPTDLRPRSLDYFRTKYEETGDYLYGLILDEPQLETQVLNTITIPVFLAAAEREMFRDGLFEEMWAAFPDVRGKIMEGHKHDTYIIGQDILYPDLLAFFGEG